MGNHHARLVFGHRGREVLEVVFIQRVERVAVWVETADEIIGDPFVLRT